MLAAKKTGLLPILNSKNGFHFTGYISNDHNVASTEKKLRRLIEETYEYLQPVMETERLSKFLEPIEALLQNVSSLSAMQGNIGIFRNESSLRVICLPISVGDTFVVATSFHVKPLLKWLQIERDFHLLTFDESLAYLFKGDSNSFVQVSTFHFSNGAEPDDGTRLLHWLRTYRGSTAPDLFVMGSSALLDAQLSKAARRSLFADVALSFEMPFEKASLEKTCMEIRSIFAQRAQADLQKNLIEFSVAEDQGRIAKNIFQISKAVARGEVRKLMVAADAKVFGKIDPKTGGLAINPYHLDHEDDDILDDLAQAVIAQGGEVIVAAEEEMPRARIAMAILKSENMNPMDEEMESL